MLGIGLQHKSVEDISEELDLPTQQILGLFNRLIRKVMQVYVFTVTLENISQFAQESALNNDIKVIPFIIIMCIIKMFLI